MDALVASLMLWISIQSGLTATDTPRILLVPEQQMASMTGGTADPEGIYVYEQRSIYLPDSWNADTLRDRATLVHELAHHVLKANKVEVQCERAYEAESYRLEFLWLREQGVQDPYEFLGTNELAIILRSACRDF
jgi:hypothetical protein